MSPDGLPPRLEGEFGAWPGRVRGEVRDWGCRARKSGAARGNGQG